MYQATGQALHTIVQPGDLIGTLSPAGRRAIAWLLSGAGEPTRTVLRTDPFLYCPLRPPVLAFGI